MAPALAHPAGETRLVKELQALLVDAVKQRTVELVQIAARLQRVVSARQVDPRRAVETDRHAPEHHVLGKLRLPDADQGAELAAMRARVGEELDDLDLSRAVGGLPRLDLAAVGAFHALRVA